MSQHNTALKLVCLVPKPGFSGSSSNGRLKHLENIWQVSFFKKYILKNSRGKNSTFVQNIKFHCKKHVEGHSLGCHVQTTL